MGCRKIVIREVDVVSPVIPSESSFEDTLFNPDEFWVKSREINMKALLKPYAKEARRMNRTSSLAYLSASNLMRKIDIEEDEFNPYRFGTVFSTHNASYENVLRILRTLYTNGTEGVSPIDFSYSVGNSLLSGITMKYNLKGPSIVLPSSEPLYLAKIILTQEEIDSLLVGSYNICLKENFSYYDTIDYLRGDDCKFTNLFDNAIGGVIREVGVSMILDLENYESEEKKCYLSGLANIRKRKVNRTTNMSSYNRISTVYNSSSDYELSVFCKKDFIDSMNIALRDAGIELDEVDAVFSCACGHPGLDLIEYEAITETFNDKMDIVAVQGIFGMNYGGNFMLNCAAAVSALRHQCLPATKGVLNEKKGINLKKKEKRLRTVLVNGYNDLGNIISGVIQWN